jgi:hypothetical protein
VELTPEVRALRVAIARDVVALIDDGLVRPRTGNYAAAELKAPQVIFVSSPLVAVLAGCFASVIWHERQKATGNRKASLASYNGVSATLNAAIDTAVNAAVGGAGVATDGAPADAASPAKVLRDAIRAAARAAIDDATCVAIDSAAADAPGAVDAPFMTDMLKHCESWFQYYNGGNQWSSSIAHLWFFQHVCGLDLPAHAKFQHYVDAAVYGGPRFMHREYCLVSDRPEFIRTEVRNGVHVPHCTDGPSHLWRDGWAFWYIDGVRVDEQIVMRPETQTLAQLRDEPNAEIKRIRIARFGWERYLIDSDAELVHSRHNDVEAQEESLFRTGDGLMVLACRCPSTHKLFHMEVPAETTTCDDAQLFLSGGLSAYTIDAA